jgi:D-arginine dehydrogenase
MADADFLIVGGGIAGLSAAARLGRHGKAIVLEAEEAIGYHSSGRSVSFSHYGIGNEAVRALTASSRRFFEQPPEGFCETPVASTASTLYFAEEEALPRLEALQAEMARFTDRGRWIGADEIARLCPVLKTGTGGAVRAVHDPTGLKLDTAALLHAYARELRGRGGELRTGRRIAAVARVGELWSIRTETDEELSAPVLVNAAGAWADRLAALASVRPLGLRPLRRTIIAVDPPSAAEVSAWPFVHSAAADFYMLPEAGQLLVSPMDEVDDDACDAQAHEYEVALAAERLEHYTRLGVSRIAHRWAGLRTFTADRVPTAGFAPDAPGFFWLVGQGGYGFQTAPAMAKIAEALIARLPWPADLAALGLGPERIVPERLLIG